jgi:hypothetical protein
MSAALTLMIAANVALQDWTRVVHSPQVAPMKAIAFITANAKMATDGAARPCNAKKSILAAPERTIAMMMPSAIMKALDNFRAPVTKDSSATALHAMRLMHASLQQRRLCTLAKDRTQT